MVVLGVFWSGFFPGLAGSYGIIGLPCPASTHSLNVADFLTLMADEVEGPSLYAPRAIVWCPSTIGALVVRCYRTNSFLASTLICLFALHSPGPIILVC